MTPSPYPGIRPFGESDSELFFGRDEEIEQLLKLLSARRFLTVLGVSGSGKSSLVRAGVIPVLRAGISEPLGTGWRVVAITPGTEPLARLHRSLRREFGRTASPETSWPATSFALTDEARALLAADEKLLVFIDQFEEVFEVRKDQADASSQSALFVNLLLNAVGQRQVPVYVVMAMRSDYLGESAQFIDLPEAMNKGHYLVPRMTRHQQQQAIEAPLAALGLEMHPALLQRLLNESSETVDSLPILQHLLKRVWEWQAEQPGLFSMIGIDAYTMVGGWKKALDLDAERVLNSFQGERDAIGLLFRWITDSGASQRPVRRPRPFSELPAVTKLESERLRQIIQAFQTRDLLRGAGEELGDHSLVDLPHESVCWQWERLQSWINEEAQAAASMRFIVESARKNLRIAGSVLAEGIQLKEQWSAFPLWRERYLADRVRVEQTISWIDFCATVDPKETNRPQHLLSIMRIGHSALLAGGRDRGTVVSELLQESTRACGASGGAIFLLDRTRSMLVPDSSVGYLPAPIDITSSTHDRAGAIVRVVLAKMALLIHDTAELNELGTGVLPEARSLLAIPILNGFEIIGVLTLQDERPGRFTEEDRILAETAAMQVAIVLDNEKHLESLSEERRVLRALTLVASRIGRLPDVDSKLRLVLTGITADQGLGFSRAMLFLVDEQSNSLRGRFAIGSLSLAEAEGVWISISPAEDAFVALLDRASVMRQDEQPLSLCVQGISVPLEYSSGALALSCLRKSPQLVPAGASDPSRALLFPAYSNLNEPSFICVPLIGDRSAQGVIVIDNAFLNSEPFNPESMERAQLFAELAAISIADQDQADRRQNLAHSLRHVVTRQLTSLRNEKTFKGSEFSSIVSDLSHIQRGLELLQVPQQTVQLQRVYPAAILREVSRDARLDVLIRGGELAVEGDADLLRGIFAELVRNAEDTRARRIMVSLADVAVEGRRLARIEIEDDGPGVPTEAKSRIFDSGVSSKGEGRGLGLYMVRKMLAMNRGTISETGGPNTGARFVIHLPLWESETPQRVQ